MRVGVTGSKGMLGAAVSSHLAAAGHLVVNLDSYCRAPSPSALECITEELDWVLHFAARTSIADSHDDPEGFVRDNLASTRAALDVASSRRSALLFMSSYVYGRPRYNPIDEQHSVSSLNAYMASKLESERLCQDVCLQQEIPLVILRPFSIFGARRQPGRLVSDLLEYVRTGEPLEINDSEPRRDHLYVVDFCGLVQLIVEASPRRAGLFNVGSGVGHSNLEVAELVRRLAGDERPVQVAKQPRRNDVSECVAELSAVEAAFHWQPRHSLEVALSELLDAQRVGLTR